LNIADELMTLLEESEELRLRMRGLTERIETSLEEEAS
jgi:hypothetical protein